MLEPQISEWVSQLLRWVHVITAMAWIGSSFYFIHLDLSLKKRDGLPAGVGGEAWQVHGGGFYNMRKYLVAPPELPKELTWFKWESYSTWITGFFLLCWVYYHQAGLYTIDPAVLALSPWQAAAIGIGGLGIGWLVYDGLCRSPLGKNDALLVFVLFAIRACRGLGLHACLQRACRFPPHGRDDRDLDDRQRLPRHHPKPEEGRRSDSSPGRFPTRGSVKEAKLRSTHNNYLTLPVVFLMLSDHYPLGWSSRYAVAIIGLVIIAGAIMRHFFNSQHAGKG